jgi:hypothetical protein
MTLAKLLLAAAATLTAVAAMPATAQADRFRVRIGGHVHVGGHVQVVVGRPAPPPPPTYACDYGCSNAGYYYEPAPAPPPPAPMQPYYGYPTASAPRRPSLGLGLMMSSVELDESGLAADGAGLLGRLRVSPRLELEVTLASDQYRENPRIDTRIGAAALIGLGQPGGFTPYLVLGAGANVVQPQGQDTNMDALPAYGYLEAGIGLSWELTPHFSLTGDLRLQARHLSEDSTDPKYRLAIESMPKEERATEGRLSAIYYF